MSIPIRILLADDHHMLRQAIRALLEKVPEFAVVGEVSDALLVGDEVVRLEPDVLVLDFVMPGLGVAEIARQVTRRRPETRVLVMSTFGSEPHLSHCFSHGAHGYVHKESTAADLIQAIRDVAKGDRYPSDPAPAPNGERLPTAPQRADPYEKLTPREREVLHLAAEGYGNVEIGSRLGISPRTAETHRAHVMQKMGFRRLAEVIRYAMRRGILPPGEEVSR